MKLRSIRSLTLAFAASSLGVTACSGAPGDGAASTEEAYVHTKSFVIAEKTFDSAMITMGIPSVSFQMTDGNGTLTPPPLLAALAGLQSVSVQFGGAHMSPDWPAPDGTAYAQSVTVNGVSIVMDGASILASATVSAEIHYVADHWYNPSTYITVDPSAIAMRFVPDGQGGLKLSDVQSDVHYHAHDCGFAGWCTSAVDGKLPDLNALVKQYAGVAFSNAQPQVNAAWSQILNRMANGGLFADPSTWTWAYDLPSPSLAAGNIYYTASRHEAPPAPSCTMVHDCNTGLNDMQCYATIGTLSRFRQHTSGAWLDYSASKSYPSWQLTDNYMACQSDVDGQTCSNFTQAPTAFKNVGACPKPPPPKPPTPICTLNAQGVLVCKTGGGTTGGAQ